MQALRLTVGLMYVSPPVTRVIDVPQTITLDRLHMVLQAAMGWFDQHLYTFDAGARTWADKSFAADLDADPAQGTTLAQALAAAPDQTLLYTYDMGDSWEHRITVAPHDTGGSALPALIAAEGACPPEDVGGPPGYEVFLEAMANPRHPDHADLMDWHGGPFDPDDPDIDTRQAQVTRLARRWAPRPRKT